MQPTSIINIDRFRLISPTGPLALRELTLGRRVLTLTVRADGGNAGLIRLKPITGVPITLRPEESADILASDIDLYHVEADSDGDAVVISGTRPMGERE